MSDDPKSRDGRDRSRISLDQEHEVKYWTQSLGVSRQELEEAVRSVGNSADKVREHLAGRQQT